MGGTTEGHHPGRHPSGTGLPDWAARHLAESGDPRLLTGPTPTSGATGRHRRARRAADEPSRLRGWGMAVAAIAAAAGAVPLAVSTLAREDVPLPQIGAFPVASPLDLPEAAADTPGRATAPGPDVAAVLPPLGAPALAPTSSSRELPAAPVIEPAAAAPAPPPSPVTPTTQAAPATATSTVPATASTSPSTEPRQAASSSRSPERTSDRTTERSSDRTTERSGSPRTERSEPGLVGGLLGTVGGTVGGLLN